VQESDEQSDPEESEESLTESGSELELDSEDDDLDGLGKCRPSPQLNLLKPVFDGARHSLGEALEMIFDMRSACGETDANIKRWYSLINVLLNGNLPPFGTAERSTLDSCPDVERIAACKNDCVLFYDCKHVPDYKHANDKSCHVCGSLRSEAKVHFVGVHTDYSYRRSIGTSLCKVSWRRVGPMRSWPSTSF